MGTSGLVGPLAAYASMTEAGASSGPLIVKIMCLYFIAPALISLAFDFLMRKSGLIKAGDVKLKQ